MRMQSADGIGLDFAFEAGVERFKADPGTVPPALKPGFMALLIGRQTGAWRRLARLGDYIAAHFMSGGAQVGAVLRGKCAHAVLLARKAMASVPSSSTSNAPPIGTPCARREIGTPKPCNCATK